MGTLQAKGLIPDTARVLVADFTSSGEDTLTVVGFSEVVRAGLASSPNIRVLGPDEIRPTLETMRVPPGTVLTQPVAVDAAVREGIPVVLVGDLASAGASYVVNVRLLDPEEGKVLLRLSEKAASKEDLLGTEEDPGALDRLVATVRERIGESFRSLRDRKPLPYVTTHSLEALRLYARALQASRSGDYELGGGFLREALARDSTFAMIWRVMGFSPSLTGAQRTEALTRAYELRDRLSERERLSVTGSYFLNGEIDYQRSVDAYRVLTELYPEDENGWNNLSVGLSRMGDFQGAQAAARRAVELAPTLTYTATLWEVSATLGDVEVAREALALRREHFPGRLDNLRWEGWTASVAGDRIGARRAFQAVGDSARSRGQPGWVLTSLDDLWRLDLVEGRCLGARDRYAEVIRRYEEAGNQVAAATWGASLALWDFMVLARGEEALTRMRSALQSIDDPAGIDQAWFFAFAGQPARAQELLEDWEREVDERRRPGFIGEELNLRGRIALAEGRGEEGVDLLRQGAVAMQNNASYLGELAWAYDQEGFWDAALSAYQRYVDGPTPWHWYYDGLYLPLAYERLGQLYEERGETEEAAKYHSLFVDLWVDADPELQPRVQAAREALERIGSER